MFHGFLNECDEPERFYEISTVDTYGYTFSKLFKKKTQDIGKSC